MPEARPIRTALASGRTQFGLWSTLPGTLPAELAAATGYDYVCVDQQHGAQDQGLAGVLQAIQAGGSTPLVRVPGLDPGPIGRALDLGALGVIVPMVDDAAQAARAVAACRYPPGGHRSYGPVRAALALGAPDLRTLGDEPLCLVMVETRAALDNLDAIAATPGLDGIYIGPSDLALALGREPQSRLTDPLLVETIDRIRDTCVAHGLLAGLHCLDSTDAVRFAGRGFSIITVAVDSLLLRDALARELLATQTSTDGHRP